MPAFELDRLRSQVDDLLRYFTQPDEFRRRIQDLFVRYGNFALRVPNSSVNLIPSYQLNPQVFEFIRVELCHLSIERPAATPQLVRVLWSEPYLEPMQLATHMIGEMLLDPPEIVEDLIFEGMDLTRPMMILDQLLYNGSRRLRREMPVKWLDQIEVWLGHTELKYQTIALKAMLTIIRDPQFENLPPIFRLLSPYMMELKPDNRALLTEVLKALVERSPNELAFFLRQFILIRDTPEMNLRMIRQIIPLLPTEFQKNLLDAFDAR